MPCVRCFKSLKHITEHIFLIVLIAEADRPAVRGGDGRICEEAAERRRQTEGQGAAAEGLQHHERQRREFAQLIHQHGENKTHNSMIQHLKLQEKMCQ